MPPATAAGLAGELCDELMLVAADAVPLVVGAAVVLVEGGERLVLEFCEVMDDGLLLDLRVEPTNLLMRLFIDCEEMES